MSSCLCSDMEESLSHILFSYPVVNRFWKEVGIWFGTDEEQASSLGNNYNF